MSGIRKFLYGVAGFVTFCLLLQLAYAFAFSGALADKGILGTALKDSGAYEKFVPLLTEDAAKNATNNEVKDLLADKEVRAAITSAVKPQDIEKSAQTVIDALYDWLEGKTDTPTFTLDLTNSRDAILDNLASYAEQKSSTLPVCTIEQLQTVNFEQDILNIPCVPLGITTAQIGERFKAQALREADFLQDPVIESTELFTQEETKQAEQDAASVPELYQNMQDSKWTTLALTLLLLFLLVMARRDKYAGIRVVAKILVASGAVLGLFVLIFWLVKTNISVDNATGQLVTDIVFGIVAKIIGIVQWFALGYLVVGAALLFRFKKPTVQAVNPAQDATAPNLSVTSL